MPMPRNPKHLPGTIPGKDFVDTHDANGIKIGMITRVDEVNLKADIKILSGSSERYEIDLTQSMSGPRSFWGGIPEVNSMVVVGYRRIQKHLTDAVILGYIPTGNRSGLRFDPFSPDNPAEISDADRESFERVIGTTRRIKRLNLRPGDVGGMSSSGAELTLTKDVKLVNRAGDLFELRDADRTIISQAIHRVESEAGVKRISGPIRRGTFFIPNDLLKADGTLRDTDTEYYGRDTLQLAGPGVGSGSNAKFSNQNGKLLPLFNDTNQFPPVTYSNGRRVHYPPTSPAVSIEDPNTAADAFVEDRLELNHTSDLTQDVIEEIDGFSMDRRTPYIDRVLGTMVGNDASTTRGQRQYAKILKPRIFPDFLAQGLGKFTLEEVDRNPTVPDIEATTSAAAFFFRMRPPRSTGDNAFVAAVSKQGKLFLNVPASTVEDYTSGSKKVSVEMNLEGALKAFIGASNPDRISAHITLEGGLHLDIGSDAAGNAITTRYHSGTRTIYEGNPNEDDVTADLQVRGVKQSAITGAELKTIEGSKKTIVSGQYKLSADRINLNAFQGASFNFGEVNQMVNGKTQLNYALQVLENIALGGKVSTILAGGLTQNVVAGAISYSALAGAISFNAPAGAYSVTVGTGAMSMTTAAGAVTISTASGAMSLAAGAGAMSLTAGLAMNLAASTKISMVAPQILLGGPTATFGVLRGIASLPPGAPTLDPITGTPLLGSALVRSI